MARLVLGLNTDHGDSSAALVSERGILGAIAEERINRRKHCADFPRSAIAEVLKMAGASVEDVTDVAVARDPYANARAKALFVARYPANGLQMVRDRLKVHRGVGGTLERLADGLGIERGRVRASFHNVEHHLAHIASAYYWSPFERACALSIDGAGDFATTMSAQCAGSDIRLLSRSYWPHSLGVFYTAICQFIGFDKYGEEYKVMGLSAYGRNSFSAAMRDVVSFDLERGIRLNLKYFRHIESVSGFESVVDGEIVLPTMWGPGMQEAFGPPRQRSMPITDRDRDIAASMQARYEEIFLQMVSALVAKTKERKIVLAGGCALNSVANGRMVSEGYVDKAYFQPAASDDGTAVGAALHVLHAKHRLPRTPVVEHSFWGPEYKDEEVEAAVKANGRAYTKLSREELLKRASAALAAGKIVGWFHGREEWGPRALGNRSILCNPAFPDMKATLNSRIKNREPFRPFAPVIAEEDLSVVFEGAHPVPFMIIVFRVKPEWRPKLPAITHEDGTGRVQTVTRAQNSLYYDLIKVFKDTTGVPVLLNTSFNENEPIVHTPQQALDCFERTRMDALSIENYWLEKA